MNCEYKTVGYYSNESFGTYGTEAVRNKFFASDLEAIINNVASEGWEYVNTINVYGTSSVLVFRRLR